MARSWSSHMPANTPRPPYYAVIFTAQRTEGDNGYDEMAVRMDQLATQQPGYLAIESARGADGAGITVSSWESLEPIAAGNRNAEQRLPQPKGETEGGGVGKAGASTGSPRGSPVIKKKTKNTNKTQ